MKSLGIIGTLLALLFGSHGRYWIGKYKYEYKKGGKLIKTKWFKTNIQALEELTDEDELVARYKPGTAWTTIFKVRDPENEKVLVLDFYIGNTPKAKFIVEKFLERQYSEYNNLKYDNSDSERGIAVSIWKKDEKA